MLKDSALWQRIETFDIDGGDRPDCGFVARLGDEQGWSLSFTERVVSEYKRYVYLAVTHGRAVCPSDAVDEAWHLHLTYTRSYWLRFCGETLGQELHHDPTRGGFAEDHKHWRMYEGTLEAYREAFGCEPPHDIWPHVAKRFAGVASPGTSRVREAFALLSFNPIAAGVLLAIAAGIWSFAGAVNPFSLKGGQFFLVLIPAYIVAIVLGRLVFERARLVGAMPFRRFKPLDWEETAYLAGRSGRLSSAAMARLVAGGLIKVSDDRKEISATGRRAEDLSPVERAVLDGMPISKGESSTPVRFKAMQAAIEQAFRSKAVGLERDGAIVSEKQMFAAWLLALLPLLLVQLGLATPRLFMGLSTNKPVFFLVVAMIAATVVAFAAVRPTVPNHRTRKGDELLEKLRKEHQPLQTGKGLSRDNTQGLSSKVAMAAGLGVGLFGVTALANAEMPELSDLDRFLPARQGQTSGCGGGCGSSTSGGGSGGDGGGGCSGCGGGGGD